MYPLVPRFATIRSILSAWVVTSQHTSFRQATSQLIGGQSDGDHSMGQFAEQLNAKVFRGAYSTETLLNEHTHFGLFTSFLSASARGQWRRNVATGSREGLSLVASLKRQQQFEAPTLRFCPACVQEDRKVYGFGHWRLFHQWPLAQHCVVHGDRLLTHCKDCGASIERTVEEQLPGTWCQVCGCREFVSQPLKERPGYWPLLRLLYRTLEGQNAWAQAKELSLELASALIGAGGKDLLSKTLDDWGVTSVEELGQILGFSGSRPSSTAGTGSVESMPWLLFAAMVASSGIDEAAIQRAKFSWPPN